MSLYEEFWELVKKRGMTEKGVAAFLGVGVYNIRLTLQTVTENSNPNSYNVWALQKWVRKLKDSAGSPG